MTNFPVLLGLLVALSGCAGLIYEMLWIRALGLHFGASTPAVTTVVATFMAGLGLGNAWFGRRADRSTRPFALYQRLELGVALSGALVSLFLLRGGEALDALARVCARAGPLSIPAMACTFACLMLLPATAMGGTLPVLSRALSRDAQMGQRLGLLYACNTLGAIAGALVPDFILIPRYGLTICVAAAVGCNLAIALLVRRYVEPPLPSTSSRPSQPAPATDAAAELSRTQLVALVISAVGGFGAMGLEVLWSRTLQHWAAALVTSFAVLLAVYLSALALGALLTQRVADRSAAPLRHASLLLGITALTAFLPIALAPSWRELERALWPRPSGFRRLGLLREAVDALWHAGYLETLACLAMGASFPFIAAAWLAGGKPGTRTGQLFLVNTFAGVLGALVMGFVWLPQLGEQASYGAVTLLMAATAAACALACASADRRASLVATLGCAVAVLALVLLLPNDQLHRAHFRSGGRVMAIEEGTTTTAAAAARFVYGEPYYVELLTPGISMSSTRGDARRYMAMMAHAALLSARTPKRALLICYGVGNTASALLSHHELERLDVVDISHEVLALAPQFAAARGDNPLDDPRTRVFVDDGRHHLITRDDRYDVITTEPPPPNYAGVVNLYSRELYRLAKHRLTPGGVITQWLPVFQLSDDDVRSMIAAFVAELPHTALLYGDGEQLILIGSLEPLGSRTAELPARVSDPALLHNLRSSYIGLPEDVLGSVLQTDAELRRQVAHVTPLSDEQPAIQYPFENVSAHSSYLTQLLPDPKRALLLLGAGAPPELQQRVASAARATEAAIAARLVPDTLSPEARELELGRILQPELDAHPQDEGLWQLLAIDTDRVRLATLAMSRPGAAALLASPRDKLSGPELARYLVLQDALWVLARRAYYEHDYLDALAGFDQISADTDNKALYALLRGNTLRALGRKP